MKIWQKVHVRHASIVIYQLSKQNAIKCHIWFGMKLDTLNYLDARLLCEIVFGNMDWVGMRNAKLFTLTKIDFFELFTNF
jgi:hypothetical protein